MGRSRHILQLLACVAAGVVAARPGGAAEAAAAPGAQVRTIAYPDGGKYVGQVLGTERHGQGTHTWPDGSSYEGGWQRNALHGQGTYRWPDGRRYVGAWEGGKAAGGWLHAADGGKLWCRHDAEGRWVVVKKPETPTPTPAQPPTPPAEPAGDTVESLCARADAYTRRYIDSLLTDGDAIAQSFACAREAQKLDPASPLPHIAMARAFTAQRKPREALEQAERARELDPKSAEAARLATVLRAKLDAAKPLAAKPEPSPTTQARAPAPSPSAPVETRRHAFRDRLPTTLRDALAFLERGSPTTLAVGGAVAVLVLAVLAWLVGRRVGSRRGAAVKRKRPAAQAKPPKPTAAPVKPEPPPKPTAPPAPKPDAAPAPKPALEPAPEPTPEPETPPAAAAEERPEPPAGAGAAEAGRRAPRFCSACGQQVEPGAKFCSQCGHRLG